MPFLRPLVLAFWRIINLRNSSSTFLPSCCFDDRLTVSATFNKFSWLQMIVWIDFVAFLLQGFFFYSRTAAACVVFQSAGYIPEASPTIILKENCWWIEWQTVASINVCIIRGIYLINSCFNPSAESLLLPSRCSIWSPCKHSALWCERTDLKWISALLHGFTDRLKLSARGQNCGCSSSRWIINLIFEFICGLCLLEPALVIWIKEFR